MVVSRTHASAVTVVFPTTVWKVVMPPAFRCRLTRSCAGASASAHVSADYGKVFIIVAGLLNLVAPQHVAGREWLAGYVADGANPFKEWLVFEGMGVFAGALLSGLLARRALVTIEKGRRVTRGVRLLLAFAGGMVMALGAALGRGCTSGQALTGGSLLKRSGNYIFSGLMGVGIIGLITLGAVKMMNKK